MPGYVTDYFNENQAQPAGKPFGKNTLNTDWHTVCLIKRAINLIRKSPQSSTLRDRHVTRLLTYQRVTIHLGVHYRWSLY